MVRPEVDFRGPVTILHTNDLHGGLTDAKQARLQELRGGTDLYFDCGDAVGRPRGFGLGEDPVFARLAALRCDGFVPGNHEFLLLPFGSARIDSDLPIVCANLSARSGGALYPASRIIETSEGKIGVIGVTTELIKYSRRPLKRFALYAAAFAAQTRIADPVKSARREAMRIRGEVKTIILLSHLGLRADGMLAESIPEIDIILGAHSHHKIPPQRLGKAWYAQAGVSAESAGVYGWDGRTLSGELVPLG